MEGGEVAAARAEGDPPSTRKRRLGRSLCLVAPLLLLASRAPVAGRIPEACETPEALEWSTLDELAARVAERARGSVGTFFSYLTIDPKARLVVAFATNAGPSDGQPQANRVVEEILGRYAYDAEMETMKAYHVDGFERAKAWDVSLVEAMPDSAIDWAPTEGGATSPSR